MARITWQNVTAPDLTRNQESRTVAAKLISNAFDSVGSGLQSLDARSRDKSSAAAMNEAMKIRDLAEWERVMDQSGLAGLGITPDRANPALMQFAQGYRDTLFNRQTGDYRFGREVLRDQRADAEIALNNAALALADRVAYDSYSPEEATQRIIDNTQDNPALRDATLGVLGQMGETPWTTQPGMEFSDQTKKVLDVLDAGMSERNINLVFDYGGNDALRLLGAGLEIGKGYNNPIDGFIDSVTNAVQGAGLDKDEAEAVSSENSRTLTNAFNDIKNSTEFGSLPNEVIVAALRSKLEGDWVIWKGGKNNLDIEGAKELLREINTEENREALSRIGSEIKREQVTLSDAQNKAERLQEKLRLALSRGDQDEVNAIRLELAGIVSDLVPAQGPNLPAPGSPTASAPSVASPTAAAQTPTIDVNPAIGIPPTGTGRGLDVLARGAGAGDRALYEMFTGGPQTPPAASAPSTAPSITLDRTGGQANPTRPGATSSPVLPGEVVREAATTIADTVRQVRPTGTAPVFADAANDNAAAIDAIQAETNLTTAEASEMKRTIAALRETPAGDERKALVQKLDQLLNKAKKNYQETKGRSANNRDPIMELLTRPEKWLNF